MNILVIGGAGFIGTNLVKELKKNTDDKIYVLDNYFSGSEENHIKGVEYIQKSTWDIKEIEIKMDVVYHFGEYSRVVPSFKDVEYVWCANLWGTTFVLQRCLEWNAKFIYSASSTKFGGDEHLCPYSWAKSKMVELVKNYRDWYGLKYEICYFYNVYGEHQISKGKMATVLGIFEEQYKNNQRRTVVAPGTQTRHFTHVKDIVDGLLKIQKQDGNREWYLQNEKEYTMFDVAKMFSKKTKDFKLIKMRDGERLDSITIKNDTQKVLNWKPKRNLKDWIDKIKKPTQNE